MKTRTHGKNGTKWTYGPTGHKLKSTPLQHFVHLQQNATGISPRVAITAVTLFFCWVGRKKIHLWTRFGMMKKITGAWIDQRNLHIYQRFGSVLPTVFWRPKHWTIWSPKKTNILSINCNPPSIWLHQTRKRQYYKQWPKLGTKVHTVKDAFAWSIYTIRKWSFWVSSPWRNKSLNANQHLFPGLVDHKFPACQRTWSIPCGACSCSPKWAETARPSEVACFGQGSTLARVTKSKGVQEGRWHM